MTSASKSLQKVGLRMVISRVLTPKNAQGTVVSEQPASGSKVAKGSTVETKVATLPGSNLSTYVPVGCNPCNSAGPCAPKGAHFTVNPGSVLGGSITLAGNDCPPPLQLERQFIDQRDTQHANGTWVVTGRLPVGLFGSYPVTMSC
jgi:hypothetical protein